MAGFSTHFETAREQIAALASATEPPRPLSEILKAAERCEGLEVKDAASLFVWGRDPVRRLEIQAAAARVRERAAPESVEFIIPVYLTSFCQNECLYCGYRQSNGLADRVRLTLEEFERELELILSWGHRQIELVLSEDPEFGPEKLATYVKCARRKLDALGGGVVALCSPVYECEEYARLATAGLDWVAEWQETYEGTYFNRWHPAGSPKRQFEFRLDIWDRAFAAGIRKAGLGALLGLYKWRFDALSVIEHGNYLRRTYGAEPHALGIPRLKPARGVLASQKPSRFKVQDDDFRLVVSVYHLAFPRSRIFFNTRESYELNLSLVEAGDLFTVDCETLPGGYLRGHLPGQFATQVYPSRSEVKASLDRRGFACKYLVKPTAAPPVAPNTPSVETYLKKWSAEHAEIRARLHNWQAMQSLLAMQGMWDDPDRQIFVAPLRVLLDFFKTVSMRHCRNEEDILFPAFPQAAEEIAQVEDLRHDHERFCIDLDRFERQLVSYGLSGDPSALLMLGNRIIRELRAHLDREDRLLAEHMLAPLPNQTPEPFKSDMIHSRA